MIIRALIEEVHFQFSSSSLSKKMYRNSVQWGCSFKKPGAGVSLVSSMPKICSICLLQWIKGEQFFLLVFKIKEKGLSDSVSLELSAERPKHCLESLFPDILILCLPSVLPAGGGMGLVGLYLRRSVDSTGARLTLCLQLQLPASLSKKKSCQQGVGGLPAAVLLSQAACSQPSRQWTSLEALSEPFGPSPPSTAWLRKVGTESSPFSHIPPSGLLTVPSPSPPGGPFYLLKCPKHWFGSPLFQHWEGRKRQKDSSFQIPTPC